MAIDTAQNLKPPHYHPSASNLFRFCTRTEFKNFTSVATVNVGPSSEAQFLIHRELLTVQSPFFAAALNGSFRENSTQSICLPDVSVPIFELFIHWLYSSSLPSSLFIKDEKPMYYTVMQLYILADRLQFEALRNDCVDLVATLADETNTVLTPSDTWILYESSPPTCRMRKLVIDLFTFKKTDRLLQTHPDEWHNTFLRDLIVGLKRPREDSVDRHIDLKPWTPRRWAEVKVCDACRKSLIPGYEAWSCGQCARAWCRKCKDDGKEWVRWEGGKDGCVPWRSARCTAYHEHRESATCCENSYM